MGAISEYGHSIKTWKNVLRCSGFIVDMDDAMKIKSFNNAG
jgi:hypothetical protein